MRVLILEDEPLIALDLECVVETEGFEPIGPFSTVKAAAAALGTKRPDFALLDVDLPDGKSFDLAVRLAADGVPFAFLSGSRPSDLPPHLRHARFLAKPFRHESVRRLLPVAAKLAS